MKEILGTMVELETLCIAQVLHRFFSVTALGEKKKKSLLKN